MVFGKLGEQYELAALKSAVISLYRLLLPIGIVVLIFSYGSFLFSNYIMPIANLKNGAMIYDIQKKKPALNNEADQIIFRKPTNYTKPSAI